ncbi:hypothetical protein ACOME3_005182 [Neoechinorhynchus agilis]
MNGERESDKYSTLIDVVLKKCFERATETLKDSLIEAMSTVKKVLAKAIQCEMETLKNEQLIEVKKCKGKKANGSKRKAKISKANFKKQAKDLLETNCVLKTENISTFARDLVPPLKDIQPAVLHDSNLTVDEYDHVTVIKGNDRKKESDPAELIATKATVEQKVQATPERVETRAKGRTLSKSINPSIHFGNDTPPPRPSSPVALNSTLRIMHNSIEDRNRTIFISGMPEAPPLMHKTATKSFEPVNSFSPTFTPLFLPH